MGKRHSGKPKWLVSEWLEDDDRRVEALLTLLIAVLVGALLWSERAGLLAWLF